MTEFTDPWQAQAKEKGLPEEFIKKLESSDAVTEAEKARIVASVSTAADLEARRAAAIEMGRRYGTDEANRRRETGDWRENRIRRAMAYAAWEFDGKPPGGAHLKEFGIDTNLTPSLDRAVFGRLLKKGSEV